MKCRHSWKHTCWTAFNATPTEQRCTKCGAYQHRGFEHNRLDPTPWVYGENPKAAQLRLDGAPDRYEWDK